MPPCLASVEVSQVGRLQLRTVGRATKPTALAGQWNDHERANNDRRQYVIVRFVQKYSDPSVIAGAWYLDDSVVDFPPGQLSLNRAA